MSVFKTSNSYLQKWKVHVCLCETDSEWREILLGATWYYYGMKEEGWINYVNIYHTAEAALPTSCLTTAGSQLILLSIVLADGNPSHMSKHSMFLYFSKPMQ